MIDTPSSICRLCSIVSNPFISGEIRPCDTPFYYSKSFITIPALGALCLGHAMIVSRQHYSSLLSMDAIHRKEFESVCISLESVWPTFDLTFAEHGSSCFDNAGPCIAHTHINIIPNVQENMLTLQNYGHTLIATGSLDSLPNMTDAYFLIGKKDNWFLYNTGSAPSQHIRQLLYASYDLPHWDWRLLPNEELAEATLNEGNLLFRLK